MLRMLAAVCVVVLCVSLVGCGSTGAGPGSGGPIGSGQTLSVGTLQVGVTSAAGFKTLTIGSPAGSPILFMGLYGSEIVRLEEMGYGKIAFEMHKGDSEIALVNLDGTGTQNLTKNAQDDWSPDWSPDGKRIVYEHDVAGYRHIHVMNANGSNPVDLTRNASTGCRDPAWSPDGQAILFDRTRSGFGWEVFVMSTSGTDKRALTNDSGTDEYSDWSPDGQQIAFVSARGSGNDIWVMNADGSGQRPLTDDTQSDLFPAWSPGGRQIAFSRDIGGNQEIFVMGSDGSNPVNLTSHPSDDSRPTWSPDGKRLAFQRDTDIWVMNSDGMEPRNVTKSSVVDGHPSWCPAPSVVRTLIGPAGSDGGYAPPFGAARPLVVVGMTAYGLTSATTVAVPAASWGGLRVAAITGTGDALAGVKVTAARINSVIEDMGRGLPTRLWAVGGNPRTGAVLILFSGVTGRVATVIGTADTALDAEQAAEIVGRRVVLRAEFTELYQADDPGCDMLRAGVTELALDARTGEVVGADQR